MDDRREFDEKPRRTEPALELVKDDRLVGFSFILSANSLNEGDEDSGGGDGVDFFIPPGLNFPTNFEELFDSSARHSPKRVR